MSFNASARNDERDGSTSHVNGANGNGQHTSGNNHGPTNREVIANRNSDTNGATNTNGNGNTNTNGNGHTNGNGAAAGNGNGNGSRRPSFRATLSSGVSIKGTVKFRSELIIDGEVEGTIQSFGRLTVGRNAHVRGDIQTRSVTVHGTVDGNLSIGEKCELRSGCTLRGDIESSRLVVDEDVNFVGSAAIATRDYLSEMRPPHPNGQK
jgi:cytoskeletal protein CcmA (bactofilin family)